MHSVRDSSETSYSALRVGRCSLEGEIYLVSFGTVGRRSLFAHYLTASTVCRCLIDQRLWYRSRLLGWVLMPDHWHGVIQLGQADDLSVVVQRLKTHSTRALRREVPGLGRIWERGFQDRVLQTRQQVIASARSVVAQPVRAGLVERVADYPYWNAVWL